MDTQFQRQHLVPCRICSRGNRSKLTGNVSAICDDCNKSASTEQVAEAKNEVRLRLIEGG